MKFNHVFSFNFEKGRSFEDFSVTDNELIYIKTGKGTLDIQGLKQNYSANDIILLKAKQVRTQLAVEKSSYICLRFQGEIHSLLSQCFSCPDETIYQLCKNILDEYKEKNAFYYEICNLRLEEIIIHLQRLRSVDHNISGILSIIKEIDHCHSYHKTVEEMAKSVHYSYDYFRHKFKEVTGKSPLQYITDSKMDHACRMLAEKDLNCTEIAYLLGFSSSSEFSKSFKKKTGVSPSQYRKNTGCELDRIRKAK